MADSVRGGDVWLNEQVSASQLDITPELSSSWGDYLAGLTDGEGCFSMASNTVNSYRCEFIIHLRADDRDLLERLREATGLGTVFVGRRTKQGTDQPSYRWSVLTKADCCRLVAIFERHPLRSKKARDFKLWAEAVRAWARQDFGRMAEIHVALKAVRHFEQAGDDWEIVPDDQLQLEGSLA